MSVGKNAVAKKPVKRNSQGHSKIGAEARVKMFVEAFLTNGSNATQAAVAAGLSPKTAASAGARMLKNVKVSTLLKQRQTELAQKYELTTESVIRSLAQAVYFDPRKLYHADGSLKMIHELDDDTAMALAGFEVTEEKGSGEDRGKVIGFTKKVKWLDKNTAREQAMKHFGLYLEDNKQKSPLEGVSRETLKLIVDKLNGKR